MKLKLTTPNAQHLKIRDAIIEAIRTDGADLSAIEILAVISYTVGQLVAMQDQRTITPAMAMRVVAENISAGNSDAIKNIFETNGRPQ